MPDLECFKVTFFRPLIEVLYEFLVVFVLLLLLLPDLLLFSNTDSPPFLINCFIDIFYRGIYSFILNIKKESTYAFKQQKFPKELVCYDCLFKNLLVLLELGS